MAAGLLLVPMTAWGQDEVSYFNLDGKRMTARGTILEENPREVVVQTGGGNKQTAPVNRIESVRYAKQPAELVQTRVRERQGRWEEALEDYKRISQEVGEDQKFLMSTVIFGAFRAAAELAVVDPKKAEEALTLQKRFAEAFPESRHHYAMFELLGRIHLAKGDFDEAVKMFAKLGEVDWPGFAEKAAVYQGVAALNRGQLYAAIPHFDRVIQSTGKDELTRQQRFAAQVYKGECLVRSAKAGEAEKLLRAALEAIDEEAVEVKAIGHNALGDALRASQKPKEAALAGYLWVNVVYNQNPEQLARALFNLAQVFQQIGLKERAQEMAARLQAEFPNSDWTRKLGAGP
jgi:tetratricopeptide (TPR) repeat protein